MKQSTDLIDLTEDGDVATEMISPSRKAGRPLGRRNGKRHELTRRLAEQAIEEGRSPLHVMLDNLVFFRSKAYEIERELDQAPANPNRIERAELRRKFKALLLVRKLAGDTAAQAAPYVHPRLNSVNIESSDGNPITFQIIGDDARL
jgi:hypothetical protein